MYSNNFTYIQILEIYIFIYRSYVDTNVSADYSYRPSLATQNFTSLVSNEEVQDMYYSSDAATQLRAAFLLSLRLNKVGSSKLIPFLFHP